MEETQTTSASSAVTEEGNDSSSILVYPTPSHRRDTSGFSKDLIENLQEKVNTNKKKFGIAFLCVCTGYPKSSNFIENCTAMEKMEYCLNKQLGYLTIQVGMNITSEQFYTFIEAIKSLTLPKNFERVLFYFFGHGDKVSIKLADATYSRQDIIFKFQSLCPATDDVYKILIFDCCREADKSQEHMRVESSANTLVINATDSDYKAFYKVNNGCGLFTDNFTELVPTRNESINDLLDEIRRRIVKDPMASKVLQMPVSESKLIGSCNLLAESQGTARIVPRGLKAHPSCLITDIHFKFDEKVEPRVKEFIAEICCDSSFSKSKVVSVPVDERMVSVKKLDPDTHFVARILAVYNDEQKVIGEICNFTTPGRRAPSDVKVTNNHQMLKYNLTWNFNGNFSDLDTFTVIVQANGERILQEDTRKECHIVLNLLPCEINTITVKAIYGDGKSTEASIDYHAPDRFKPQQIRVAYSNRFEARVNWSFEEGATNLLDCFRVSVRNRQEKVIHFKKVPVGQTNDTIQNLRGGNRYRVTIAAMYKDEVIREDSTDFLQKERICGACVSIPLTIVIIIFSILTGVALAYRFLQTPTTKYSRGRDKCELLFIQTSDSIDCGTFDTEFYDKVCLSASSKTNDRLQGTIQTWVLPQNKLQFYFQKHAPSIHSEYSPTEIEVYPIGNNNYLWNNSAIFGYVCIVNNGTVISNASIIINATDRDNLLILRETIEIPPDGEQHCFRKWGPVNPFYVNVSAYYTIVVDIPANSTYFSNATVLEAFVNASEYGKPRYVFTDNSTCYSLIKNDTKYNVGICKAPSYVDEYSFPGLKAESLHVSVCSVPISKTSISRYTYVMGSLAGLLVILLYIISLFLCCIIYKACKYLVCIKGRNGYELLRNVTT